jgi:acetyl esterase
MTAEYDTLRDEGEAYARKLIEAGNLVQVRRYPGTKHGFFTMPGTLRLAREAMSDVAEFLKFRLEMRGPVSALHGGVRRFNSPINS